MSHGTSNTTANHLYFEFYGGDNDLPCKLKKPTMSAGNQVMRQHKVIPNQNMEDFKWLSTRICCNLGEIQVSSTSNLLYQFKYHIGEIVLIIEKNTCNY